MAVVTMTGGGWGPGAKKYQTSTNVAPQTYSYTSPTATTAMQQTRQQTPAQQTQQQQQQQPNAAQTAQQPAQRSELANYMNQYYGQKGFFAGDINKARNDFQQWKGQQPAPAAAPAAGGQSALSQQLGNPPAGAAPAAAAPAVKKNAYQTWVDQQVARNATSENFDEGQFRRVTNQNLGQNYGGFMQWMRDQGYAGDARNEQLALRQQYGVDRLGGIITPAGAQAYNTAQDVFNQRQYNRAKQLGFLGVDPNVGQYGKSYIRAVG